jgi:hypothetical protein
MSAIRAATISDLTGTGPVGLTGQSASKAWGWCDGSIVLQESYNISSTTDNGNGDAQFNVTNSLSSPGTPLVGTADVDDIPSIDGTWTTTIRVRNYNDGEETYVDSISSCGLWGDLA